MSHVKRYHPLLVLLHWTVAAIAIAALLFGSVKLAPLPSSDPYKIYGLRVHMIAGMLILVLLVARLFVRRATAHPRVAETGKRLFDMAARLSHRLLYLALIGQALVGIILARQSGLFSIVFAHLGTVPSDLWIYWPRTPHYLLSRLLMFLIALHICGVFYHTFVLKGGLLHRMWFGRRTVNGLKP